MRKRKGKKKGALKLNFDGVESGGKSIPDGKYLAEVASAEEKEGESSGQPYLEWKFKIAEGKHKGGIVFDNTSLQPQALFRLRGLLECIGFDFPEDEEFEFDPTDVVGEQLTIEVVNEEYDGRDRPKVASYGAPGEEEEEDDDEDDKKSKKKKKKDEEDDDEDDKKDKKKKGKKDEDEEEEAPDDEEVESMDEDELAECIEKFDLDCDIEGKSLKKARKAVIKALEEAAEESEEEEEEEKPSKKKGKKVEFEEGDKVTFHDAETKKDYKGKIVEVEDDTATVDVKGDEWQVDVSELTAA